MKSVVFLLGFLFLIPAISQEGYIGFESGFKAGYADGSWEYRDYNFNLSASANSDFMSGYNTGYMLAKGEPAFLQCKGNALNYSKGFEAGYADGSWEYRDYNFNLSARMKSADEGLFSGYVNGYILGHMSKASKEKNAEVQAKNDALEKRISALEKNNTDLGKRIDDLETKNEALEKRVKDLETKTGKGGS
jgi:hypothetical protein